MSRKPAVPYGHVVVPADILGAALYGLGRYEAVGIEDRADGLRPSTWTCKTVVWLWENGHQKEVAVVVGTACDVLRGRPMPGGVGRITHGAVIDAFGAELAELGMTPDGGWVPVAEYLHREVPRGF